ncbi:MAG: dihydropteroate synthase [Abitibacteriaceae bacterium]|nr:dihydropteroate synthase [Abditibacteriaceae bacterium]MBV9868092.1 dihydropteroate synthase [Abditibacteriaceae bacterium]
MSIWKCGQYELPLGHKTYVMGIVNVTPDSFSGDGSLGAATVERAVQMVADGADILDIGGESTRPGAEVIPAEEELRRVLPVLEALVNRVTVPLSVDTTKAAVAQAALAAGASIINDISAGTFDSAMFPTIAGSDCGCVLMHLRGTPQTMGWSRQVGASNTDVIAEVKSFWQERIAAAENSGIAQERIALDPGFGFGKSLNENLELLRRGQELAALGCPILAATSRKSTIGKILHNAPVEERLWGTAATVALAIANGASIVRVHDVREMAQVARMTDAVVNGLS